MSSARRGFRPEAPEEGGRHPAVVVAGPTASGKSELAIRIAESVGGAVVNADSMQVYRELDILTARPGPAERARAPHLLYGDTPLAEPCSAASWRARALAAIAEVRAEGLVPVVCGGTGLYIEALLRGLAPVPEVPGEVRAAAQARLAALGGAAFRAELAARDPATAARLADGDSQRLVRAWEVAEATGRSLAEWRAEPREPPALDPFVVALAPPRAALYAACDARFLAMLGRGALEEARAVGALGLDPGLPGMKALGLGALLAHLRGEASLAAATERAQRETRRYAKRQTTWLRHRLAADLVLPARFPGGGAGAVAPEIRRFLLTRFARGARAFGPKAESPPPRGPDGPRSRSTAGRRAGGRMEK